MPLLCPQWPFPLSLYHLPLNFPLPLARLTLVPAQNMLETYALEFLPHHFLLTGVGENGILTYQVFDHIPVEEIPFPLSHLPVSVAFPLPSLLSCSFSFAASSALSPSK